MAFGTTLARHHTRWLAWVPALTSLLALPFAVLFLTLPGAAAPTMYFGFAFFGPSMLGPVMALTQGLAKVRMRALAAAICAMTFNFIGAGLGPLTVGVLSDRLAPHFGVDSIRYALLAAVSVATLGAAVCFERGAPHVGVELERAAV